MQSGSPETTEEKPSKRLQLVLRINELVGAEVGHDFQIQIGIWTSGGQSTYQPFICYSNRIPSTAIFVDLDKRDCLQDLILWVTVRRKDSNGNFACSPIR